MTYNDFDRVDINEFFEEFIQKYNANDDMYPAIFLDFTYGWTLVLIQGFEDNSNFPFVLFDETNYTFVKTNSPVFDITFIKDFKETTLKYFEALGLQLTEKKSD